MQDRHYSASVYQKPNGKWVAQLPPSLGKRTKTVATEAEAWAWVREQYAKLWLGHDGDKPDRTIRLGDLIIKWLESKTLSGATREDYRIRIEKYVVGHLLAHSPIGELRPHHVDLLVRSTPENWTRIHLSKILAKFFDWCDANDFTNKDLFARASEVDRLVKNAYRIVRANHRRESTERTWEPKEFVRFMEHEPSPVYRALWMFIAVTGARRGEAIGLIWENVNLDEGWCWLADNVTTGGSFIFHEPVPKNRVQRKVYFDPFMVAVLRVLKADQDAHRATRKEWTGDFVFDRRRGWGKGYAPGIHLAPATVTQRFNRHASECGLDNLGGPHGLRRTLATLMTSKAFIEGLGLSESAAKSLRIDYLGHSPDVSDGYVKTKESMMHAAARRISELFFGDSAEPTIH